MTPTTSPTLYITILGALMLAAILFLLGHLRVTAPAKKERVL